MTLWLAGRLQSSSPKAAEVPVAVAEFA